MDHSEAINAAIAKVRHDLPKLEVISADAWRETKRLSKGRGVAGWEVCVDVFPPPPFEKKTIRCEVYDETGEIILLRDL